MTDHMIDRCADRLGEAAVIERGRGRSIVPGYMAYLEDQLGKGVKLAHMTRHMLGLFHGRPGGRSWRRILTVEAIKPGAGLEVVEKALAAVSPSNVEADAAE